MVSQLNLFGEPAAAPKPIIRLSNMRGLTLHQPWASAIAFGSKRFETRDWPLPSWMVDVPCAVTAAKRQVNTDELEAIGHFIDDYTGIARIEDIPLGCVVAVTTFYRCFRTEDLWDDDRWQFTAQATDLGFNDREFMLGNYAPGRYAWLTKDTVALPQVVPCQGNRRFFYISEEVEAEVRRQVLQVREGAQ